MLKLRRISPGHRDAFLERYERLHAWAVQMTANDRTLAEDLLHDLFIVFTLSQPDLGRIENLDGYLHTSLRNLHISHLRRATRGRFEQLSMVEYESARLSLQLISHRSELMQAQDELRRICHYACARKETANAASVLILRFFHGYYPSEIARVMGSTRQAVDVRLRAARNEAKAYLENSRSPAFINGPGQIPEIFPARFARSTADFLIELQQAIFSSHEGPCLSLTQLGDLYQTGDQKPIPRKHLAHIVSCPTCLDEVNRQLGLSPLAERYPTDTMDKDNKKGSGGTSGPGSKSGDIHRAINEWEREAREAFEHKPQELCVSVNGYLLGSQLIGAQHSELTLNVTTDERISFCEVFSEQGIRLMMMNVDDLPPVGPGELRQRIELSEARSLEFFLLFNNPFPTLHVSYRDPALATTTSTEGVDIEVGETPTSEVKSERIKDTVKDLGNKLSVIAARFRGFLNTRFWIRRRVATTSIAVLLVISAVVLFEARRAKRVDSAIALLQRSSLAETALTSDRNQVLHRTIDFSERIASGESIALRRIEVWQSSELGISARRLYDDKGSLLAGDWRRSDREQILYSHGLPPQSKPIAAGQGSEAAALTFENAWQVLPSAEELSSLVGPSGNVTVKEGPAEYLISYSRTNQAENGLLKATLVLNRADLHATGQTLTLRQGNEVREYRMVEANFERRSSSTVPRAVFEPDVELLSSTPVRTVPIKENAPKTETVPRPITPAIVVASPALEVEVLRLLNQAGADMGEQISVTRTIDDRLRVEGLTQTSERKQQLLVALSSLAGNPAINVDIQTLDEALAREAKNQTSADGPISIETTQPSSNKLAVDKELRQYFARRAVPDAQTEEAMRQFAERAIQRSLQVLKHAAALKSLSQRFSVQELRSLETDTKGKWLSLVRQHGQALQQEAVILRRELRPVFPAVSDQRINDAPAILTDEDIVQTVQRLFEICSENDRAIRLAFSISPDSSRDPLIARTDFWRSLKVAENLAMEISVLGTGNKSR